MDICIVGAGYVGLVTSACLSYLGHHVIAVDSNEDKLNALKRGEMPFFEPGLEPFVKQCVKSEFLTFTDKLEAAVKKSEIIFMFGA